MGVHQIEVDDEVMAYLRLKAEPFVDSPNSVLRRELAIQSRVRPGRSAGEPANVLGVSKGLGIPLGAPEALRQVLEVVATMRREDVERRAATRRVAKEHSVAVETVADKYGRQLGITTAEFDRLLGENSLLQLSKLLAAQFPAYAVQIREMLTSLPLRRLP